MSKAQRLSFLAVAAVIAVVAVVLLGGSDSGDDSPAPAAGPATAQATATPQEASPAETAEPTPSATPAPPLLQAGTERTLEFKQGETVRFRIRSATADHVHVHGYDLFKDVPAGKTVTMSFEADITGIFEIELEDSHQPLGQLKVEP